MLFLKENYDLSSVLMSREEIMWMVRLMALKDTSSCVLLHSLSHPSWPPSISSEQLFLQEDHTHTRARVFLHGWTPTTAPTPEA
jgi:hypothetical protein